jgi:hypothetical protein
MDRTRTIYKLRNLKNVILISILTLLLGLGLFFVITCFESFVISQIHKKVIALSISQDALSMQSQTMGISYKIYELVEKSSVFTMVFAIESFIIILFLIRMSSKTPKLVKLSPVILCLGVILIEIYYIISSFHLAANGIFSDNSYFYLKITGVILIVFANILFIHQAFRQIVLEKDLS